MSNVKRWRPVIRDTDIGQIIGADSDPVGPWVDYGDYKELLDKLDSETNRANHEERLRRTAETCAGSMSKSLEDEIRNNAALALEAGHQRKCAKEWFDRMQAAESRLGSAAMLLDELAKAAVAGDRGAILSRVDGLRDALSGVLVERHENLPNVHHPKCGLADGLPFGEGMCICLSIKD